MLSTKSPNFNLFPGIRQIKIIKWLVLASLGGKGLSYCSTVHANYNLIHSKLYLVFKFVFYFNFQESVIPWFHNIVYIQYIRI